MGRALPVVREAVARSREHGTLTTAQALAFSLFLAIPAVLLVLLGLFAIAAGPGDVESLVEPLAGVMPAEATEIVHESLLRTAAEPRGGVVMVVVGLLLAIWTTTSAGTALMEALTRAFGRRDERSFVRKRVVSTLIATILVLSAALVQGLLVLGPHVEERVGRALNAESATRWVWWSLQWPVLVAGLLAAFATVLTLGPHVDRMRVRATLPGALVAVVLWLVASGAFALYAARFGSYEKTWGTLSAVVITLLWLWLTSAAILFGAELNAATERVCGRSRAESHALSERGERDVTGPSRIGGEAA